MGDLKKILVIKLGALGDIAQALGIFESLKLKYAKHSLCLLTTKPYAAFCETTGYFDEVIIDPRSKNIFTQRAMLCRLSLAGFTDVIDLQMVDRTNFYYKLWPGIKPRWIGVAKSIWGKKCSHFLNLPDHHNVHPQKRYARLMRRLQAPIVKDITLTHLIEHATLCMKNFANPFALIVPGASQAHGGGKCWPQARYVELCLHLLRKEGITPCLIGTDDFSQITNQLPGVLNLSGKTSFYDILLLARHAKIAIGNDTGPMHLASIAKCPTLTLFSKKANAANVGGPHFGRYLHIDADDLRYLSVERVLSSLQLMM